MRILMIANRPFPRIGGGVQEAVKNLGAQFIAAGHTVAVLSLPHDEGEPIPPTDLECFYVAIPPYRHRRFSMRRLKESIRRPRGELELYEVLEQWRPDIVNCHLWPGDRLPTLMSACRALDIPVAQSLELPADPRICPDAVYARNLEAINDAAAVTALSMAIKRSHDLLSQVTRNARVIIGGVDQAAADAAMPLSRARPYLLCVSRLDLLHKAIDTLISGFALIAERYHDLDLLIAGDGPDRTRIEAQIAAAGLETRVELLGAKPLDELWTLYKGATLFAMPSRYPEGLGLVFLEAMACGTPLIGTNSGGTPEIVSNNETGLLIERNTPDELARAIRRLFDDADLRAKLGLRGKQRAAQYSWSAVAAQFIDTFDACVAARSRAQLWAREA